MFHKFLFVEMFRFVFLVEILQYVIHNKITEKTKNACFKTIDPI